jgi:hypothetical protein
MSSCTRPRQPANGPHLPRTGHAVSRHLAGQEQWLLAGKTGNHAGPEWDPRGAIEAGERRAEPDNP